MINPIEILTPDLLLNGILYDLQGNALTLQQGSKNILSGGFEAVFPSSVQADKVLIKNTSLESVNIYYKVQSEAEYILMENASVFLSGKDMLITFPQVVQAVAFKFVFASESEEYFYSFILLKSLLVLDTVLSSLRPSVFCRGGHHYTAGGNLILWREFCKHGGTLTLENVSSSVKNALAEICAGNLLLTFIFYGGFDLSQSGEYGLAAPLKTELDRSLSLWRAEMELAEK